MKEREYAKLIVKASQNEWRLDKEDADALVELGIELGHIDPSRSSKIARELQFGQVMLREDGVWACTVCGGNCGQCGMTDFYGNIGFSFDHIVGKFFNEDINPKYKMKGWFRKLIDKWGKKDA